MESPRFKQFFLIATFFCICNTKNLQGQVLEYPYTQGFEEGFTIGKAVEFLPHWWGNEVSSGTSRIYRAGKAAAHSGEAALGIVPTGTFTGELRLSFDASQLEAGELSFWLRSGKNGSGSRRAIVSLSFSADGGQTFQAEQRLEGEFPNSDTPYQQYQLQLPDEIAGQPEVVVRIRVKRGEGGGGSAARVFMDDVQLISLPSTFRLLSAAATDQNTVRLRFNRKLEKASAEDPNNYRISPGATVREVELSGAEGKDVVLEVSALQPGGTYSVHLGGVQDRERNSATGQEMSFMYEDNYQLRTYDLLMSEIHAAPNEHTLLPNVEWVEIYNASGRVIDLKEVRFADESRSSTLPSLSLEAGEYLLLTPAADAPQLEPYGRVLGLSSWPSLNNSGDILSLYSATGRLLDRVAYEQSWYNSSQKSQGGWSLERIDMQNPCLGASNWAASVAHSGGTPGGENSILSSKPDLTGPKLIQAYMIDSLTIQLVFDEFLDTTSLELNRFKLFSSNAVSPVTIVKVMPHHSLPERVNVVASGILNSKGKYSLEVLNIGDCSGNLIQKEFSSADIIFPEPGEKGEVVINEVMYNPLANSEEWVEITNTSESFINLQHWQLATYNGGIRASGVLSRDYLILPPKEFLVLSRNPDAVQSAFPSAPMEKMVQVKGLPQLPNGGDTIALIGERGNIQDLALYSDEFHSPFMRNAKGVSLERINTEASSVDPGNWISAAASSGYGTPAKPNSQRFTASSTQEEKLIVEPEVIVPAVDGQPNFTTIYFRSNRRGLQVSLRVFDAQGREVRKLATNELLGSNSFFTWDGTNEGRELVKTGYYIILLSVFDASGYSREFKKVLVVGKSY